MMVFSCQGEQAIIRVLTLMVMAQNREEKPA